MPLERENMKYEIPTRSNQELDDIWEDCLNFKPLFPHIKDPMQLARAYIDLYSHQIIWKRTPEEIERTNKELEAIIKELQKLRVEKNEKC